MIYRPFLSALYKKAQSAGHDSANTNIGHVVEMRCAIACYETAEKLIGILNRAIIEEVFGAWWFASFCKTLANISPPTLSALTISC